MIDFNSNSAFTNVYLGSNQLSGIYVGSNKVWPETTPIDYSTQYLTFTATESGTFRFSGNTVQYSLDSGGTWTALASNTDTPTVSAGSKIMWKSNITPSSWPQGIGKFKSTGAFTVEGNPMSLLFSDNFVGQTSLSGKDYAFHSLFNECSGLTSVDNLSLPATVLSQYCYGYMFSYCRSLTTVPSNMLSATTLATGCYEGLFYGCTGLTSTPDLPVTALSMYCYSSMFRNCTSLTTAPMLPAETLKAGCYYQMFYNCSGLNSVTCLATDISANQCTNQWLYNVSPSGTFTKAASMTSWTTGDSGIPTVWTVQDAS